MQLVDFSNAIEIAPEYTGSEKKKTMILDNKKYLVKFPDPNRSSKLEISYINNLYFRKTIPKDKIILNNILLIRILKFMYL